MRGLVCAAVLLASVAGCHKALEPERPVTIQRSDTVTTSATVTKIDMKTRKVTLKRADGRLVTIRAGDAVKNLAQVRVGDQVVATYQEAIVAEVRPPTAEEKANPALVEEVAAAAIPGEKPAGAEAVRMRLVGTIAAINESTREVTLSVRDGGTVTAPVRDPENLKKIKVGDQVTVTVTEAIAIAVQAAAKK